MTNAKKAPHTAEPNKAAADAPTPAKLPTKFSAVLGLLQRDHGATLAELTEATGWQPHTARAVLTGLRKKGHAIERRKRDDVTCYHLPLREA